MTAYLTVECTDIGDARRWATRIVATLEDEDGNAIEPDAVEDFEAESNPDEVLIEVEREIA